MAVESEAANGKLSGRFFYMPSFSRLFSHSCAIAQEKALGVRTLRQGCCACTVNPKCLTSCREITVHYSLLWRMALLSFQFIEQMC